MNDDTRDVTRYLLRSIPNTVVSDNRDTARQILGVLCRRRSLFRITRLNKRNGRVCGTHIFRYCTGGYPTYPIIVRRVAVILKERLDQFRLTLGEYQRESAALSFFKLTVKV